MLVALVGAGPCPLSPATDFVLHNNQAMASGVRERDVEKALTRRVLCANRKWKAPLIYIPPAYIVSSQL